MSERVAFLVPIVIDPTPEAKADVPDAFRHVQWTRLPNGDTPPAFTARIVALLSATGAVASAADSAQSGTATRSAAAPAAIAKSTPRSSRAVIALVGVVAVVLTYAVVDRFWISKHTSAKRPVAAVASAPMPAMPAIPEKSVAVLPFVDMSEKKDQEYLADGTAEETLSLLAKVPGLHVPARTSSFYFKGNSEDIPTIARRLMVTHVLEGSVRKSGNRVRITAQLVRADNGYQLWSETYDRKLDDIFKVQDEIASEVVRALKISLLDANELPHAVATKNAEAHALVLQAEYLLHRETPEENTSAIGYFQQAIRLDPDSASAWAGLSFALTLDWQNAWLPQDRRPEQQRARALQAAERAIAIDPKLNTAHTALAHVRYWFDWDWASVDAELVKALALDPGNSDTLMEAGTFAALRGHLADALQLLERATDRDPLNAGAYLYRAEIYGAMGQYTDAAVAARKAVDLSPTGSRMHTTLAKMLIAIGQPDQAVAEVEKESDPSYRTYARARTYFLAGRRADADAALATFEKTLALDWAYEIAALHALRGESDQAFLWLDRAYQRRNGGIIGTPSINVDPDMNSLRGDPRFKAYLQKLKVPD